MLGLFSNKSFTSKSCKSVLVGLNNYCVSVSLASILFCITLLSFFNWPRFGVDESDNVG